MLFAKECLLAPRSMGAICPSGEHLARAMAAKVKPGTGLVVELGAGTGAVTAALVERGIGADRLLIIERSRPLVSLLQRKFPAINIVHGDATLLSKYLPAGRHVDCIVSSLPLLSLPANTKQLLIEEFKKHLAQGTILQFTYSWGKDTALLKAGFTCLNSTRVWKNLPPARVMEYRINL